MKQYIFLGFANIFNWSVVTLAIIDHILPWLTAAAIFAAIVVSFLTGLKLRGDHLLTKSKRKLVGTEQKLKDQQLINEQLITKRMMNK